MDYYTTREGIIRCVDLTSQGLGMHMASLAEVFTDGWSVIFVWDLDVYGKGWIVEYDCETGECH
jgi:hypothetical protein